MTSKLDLSRVTLVTGDSVFTDRTLRAMARCMRLARFDNAYFFTDLRLAAPDEITVVSTVRLANIEAYSEFMLKQLPIYRRMFADFILCVQYDGYIVNPAAWSDVFFDYDYIGACWSDGVVGNGGFSLRSQRLLEALASMRHDLTHSHPEDEVIGRHLRSRLEGRGIRFAPPDIAERFSVENKPYRDSFGYHGHQTEVVSGLSIESLEFTDASGDVPELDVPELYYRAMYSPSDLNEHVKTLHRLGTQCRAITEICARPGISTAAFLYARPDNLTTHSAYKTLDIGILEYAAKQLEVKYDYVTCDICAADVEATDLLFIDGFHAYEQTRHELVTHAGKVSKYIVFHDTTTFGEQGEEPNLRGIWPAISEFLDSNLNWVLAEKYEHNHGLAVLRRINR